MSHVGREAAEREKEREKRLASKRKDDETNGATGELVVVQHCTSSGLTLQLESAGL